MDKDSAPQSQNEQPRPGANGAVTCWCGKRFKAFDDPALKEHLSAHGLT